MIIRPSAFFLTIAMSISSAFAQAPAGDDGQLTGLVTRWAAQVDHAAPLPEYPRPMLRRDVWLNLNGKWDLSLTGGRDFTTSITVPFPVESHLSGVQKHAEKITYRRTFNVPADWKIGAATNRLLLHFGAVDWEARVIVNDKPVGTHRGGYDAFTFDITEFVTTGDQTLIVEVADPTDGGTQPRGKQVRKPEGIWYTPVTGIWQTVWIEPVPVTYIQSIDVVPVLDAGAFDVTVHVQGDDGASVVVDVSDPAGGTEAMLGKAGVPMRVKAPGAKRWSPESPFLYEVGAAVGRDGELLDRVDSHAALRSVGIAKDRAGIMRLVLNGEPYFQAGVLDQGFWPDGIYTAPTDEALRFDIETAKSLGFNMIRKHVKVEPQRWYWHADQIGVLVWQDMPSGDAYIGPNDPDITRSLDSARQYEVELHAMITGLRNHPCVIAWIVFNEGWGQFDVPRIVDLTKSADPSRLVGNASGWADRGVGDMIDWHVYPGPASPKPEATRAAVLGEFGGLAHRVEGHLWTKKEWWGYQVVDDAEMLAARFDSLMRGVYALNRDPGLSASVYTQLTDVETEANGLLTYDRAVFKIDAARAARANTGKLPVLISLLPTAAQTKVPWKYTTSAPVGPDLLAWTRLGFDDSTWSRGTAGFGTEGTPGAVVGTEWNTPEIWLRREFVLPPAAIAAPSLVIHHDEDAEVYINGELVATLKGYTTAYDTVPLTGANATRLVPGKNVLAIRCRQTSGGQFIDAGLAAEMPSR